ncbi:MAG: histidine phosphatase family protein [Bellilinea sp.]
MSASPSLTAAEFWLVRHGQTDWNLERRFQGHTDILLNALGIVQARELAASLNGSRISAVYSSDLSRAIQTAAILAADSNLPVIQDKRLREISMGEWEGKIWQDVNQQLTKEMMELKNDPVNSRAAGGESLAEVALRVREFATEIADRHAGQIVLLVSHGLSLGALHCMAAGLPLSQARDMIPQNCSIVKVNWPLQEN